MIFYRRKRKSSVLFMLSILFLSHLLYPLQSYGVSNPIEKEQDLSSLYQLQKTIELEQGLTILDETYLYGKQTGETIQVQFEDGFVTIPYQAVEEVEASEAVPAYQQVPDQPEETGKELLAESTSLYTLSTEDSSPAHINREIEYPIFTNGLGIRVLYIGNIEFYLSIEDRLIVEKALAGQPTDVTASLAEESLVTESPTIEAEDIPVDEEAGSATEQTTDESTTTEEDPVDKLNAEDENPGELETDQVETSSVKEIEENIENNKTTIVPEVESNPEKESAITKEADPWQGSDAKYFEVTTDRLTVYDNSRSDSLIPIGELEKGQVYPLVSDYGNWHRIQFGSMYGYVRKSSTVPATNQALSNENSHYKNQAKTFETLVDVPVYDNSSGSLVEYGTINQGEAYPIASDYGNWWRIIFADRIGYVHKSVAQTPEPVDGNYFRADETLAIYDNRGGSLKKVGELEKGQVYPRISDYGNWHRIQFGDIYGYVRKSQTTFTSGSSIKNLNENYQSQSRKFTGESAVTVYDNTSGNLVPFGEIVEGTSYPIVSDYGNWWRIVYADRVGYVNKAQVKIAFRDTDKYFKAETDLMVYDNRGSGLKKVGELEKGQVYPRISDYGNWHRIQFGSIYGYVHKSDTTVAAGNGLKNINTNYKQQERTFTALEGLTIYDNTSGNLIPFGEISQGTSYPIVSDYGNWWQIVYADRVGFVIKSLTRTNGEDTDGYFRVVEDGLPVYDSSRGFLRKVGELEKGQVYPIKSDYGNWWRVQFGRADGYVRKSDTGYAAPNQLKNLNKSYQHSSRDAVAVQPVTVYDNTSGSLVPFGQLEKGTLYPIASDYGNWWRIIYLDRVGYVSKKEMSAFTNTTTNELVSEYRNKNTSTVIPRIDNFFINPSSNYVASANDILRDRFKITGYGTYDFSAGIPWGQSPVPGETFSVSYYRALHGHFFLNDLVEAYRQEHSKKYLDKGYEVIKDWIEKNPYRNAQHRLAWHDEGTARRLITWINFYEEARDVLTDSQLKFLLDNMVIHADLLLSEDFHSKNTNHGMFQDEALLVFSDYFSTYPKSDLYSHVAKKRLKSYFDFIMSAEGVHLEHSPAYHQVIGATLNSLHDYFSLKGEQDESRYYKSLYDNAAEYGIWVIKPDGTFPLIGDTFSDNKPSGFVWRNNSYYRYSLTSGKEGIKPEGNSIVFKEAGYAIFRDSWETGVNSTYVHFTAAYHTDYHKHSDDLSVWIYANGRDIITEAGPNGYDHQLPFTDYAYSSFAHNTLIVNDKGLPRVDDKYDKTYLSDYAIGDTVSSATGINKRYDGVTHERNVTYDAANRVIKVKDAIQSGSSNNYKLLWNIADGVKPVIKGNKVHLYADGEETMTLEITSSSSFKLHHIKGQQDPYLLGWHLGDRVSQTATDTIVIETTASNAKVESVFTIK